MTVNISRLLFFVLFLGGAIQSFAGTADHSKFDILKQEFKSGPEVTAACISCHTEAASQIHKTVHWTWTHESNHGQTLGKANVVNNFCISTKTNEPRCTSCHVGYGWKDDTFDFTSEENVDCLVCHDKTGTYQKFPSKAGYTVTKDTKFGKTLFKVPDFNYIAQNIGEPDRDNCGTCHFEGGGGDGVKHGDLDGSLSKPSRELDVHMGVDGENFTCEVCHATNDHQLFGSRYDAVGKDDKGVDIARMEHDRGTCESCHGTAPHDPDSKYNDHTDVIACQTCHIPEFAREQYTKMSWDWSKAGEFTEDGKQITRKDENGNVIYMTKKGAFVWKKNVTPEYFWFNGGIEYTLPTDKIDDSKVVQVNHLDGSPNDGISRIWPAKVHRGKQIYDTVNKHFIVPKLFGKKGSGAYWKDFDWAKSAEVGMKGAGLEYSGEYGFVATEMYWPLNHMVAPKEDAVTCNECHIKNGRLEKVAGVYIPGRDSNSIVDLLGKLMVMGALLGVIVHGSIRFFMAKDGE